MFISIIPLNYDWTSITMNPKKMLAKELAAKVNGHISEETASECVNQFFRYGNTFLLLELLNLKSEVKSVKEELKGRRDKASTLRELLIK